MVKNNNHSLSEQKKNSQQQRQQQQQRNQQHNKIMRFSYSFRCIFAVPKQHTKKSAEEKHKINAQTTFNICFFLFCFLSLSVSNSQMKTNRIPNMNITRTQHSLSHSLNPYKESILKDFSG